MIENLKEIEKSILPLLLNDVSIWNTIDVDYHAPRVERLWIQIDKTHRLMLHIIHPCGMDASLYHPHPWPSAMHILSGRYETGLGVKTNVGFKYIDVVNSGNHPSTRLVGHDSNGNYVHIKQICKLELTGDNYYEMLDQTGWHYVRPIDDICVSIMLTGAPWNSEEGKDVLPSPGELKPLSEARKIEILKIIRKWLKVN